MQNKIKKAFQQLEQTQRDVERLEKKLSQARLKGFYFFFLFFSNL